MAESGLVTEVKNNLVVVKLERQEACAKCKACIAGLESKEMFIEAENLCNAKVGDVVNVSIKNSSFIKAVFIIYTIPCIALLLGLFIGYLFSKKEIVSILVGFSFLALSYLLIKLNEKRFNTGKYRPIAEEIVKK